MMLISIFFVFGERSATVLTAYFPIRPLLMALVLLVADKSASVEESAVKNQWTVTCAPKPLSCSRYACYRHSLYRLKSIGGHGRPNGRTMAASTVALLADGTEHYACNMIY
jgi:hypothetical protein